MMKIVGLVLCMIALGFGVIDVLIFPDQGMLWGYGRSLIDIMALAMGIIGVPGFLVSLVRDWQRTRREMHLRLRQQDESQRDRVRRIALT